MSDVLVALCRELCFLGGEQPALECMDGSRVPGDGRQSRFQNQSEQMIWIGQQNRIGLRLGERQRTGYFADATHIVALVGIERSKIAICDERHRREELHAVDLSLRRECHHAVVEAICALLWRHARDVWSADTFGITCRSASVVETCLRQSIL